MSTFVQLAGHAGLCRWSTAPSTTSSMNLVERASFASQNRAPQLALRRVLVPLLWILLGLVGLVALKARSAPATAVAGTARATVPFGRRFLFGALPPPAQRRGPSLVNGPAPWSVYAPVTPGAPISGPTFFNFGVSDVAPAPSAPSGAGAGGSGTPSPSPVQVFQVPSPLTPF